MRSGLHPNPLKTKFNILNCSYRRSILTGSMVMPLKKSNLLDFEHESLDKKTIPKKMLYWYPEIKISIVQKTDPIPESVLNSPMRKFISMTINESQ